MASIRAFCGWHFDLANVGPLADITAPAGALSADKQKELYERHPCNIVRVMANRVEPGDENESDRYERAADFLRHWQSAGVLEQDHENTLYVYRQEFGPPDAREFRRGLFCEVKLEAEIKTDSAASAEGTAAALHYLQSLNAQIVPVVFSSPAEVSEILDPLESAIGRLTPLQCNDDSDTVHSLWSVTDHSVIRDVVELMQAVDLTVSGNAEYFSAANQHREQSGTADNDYCLGFITESDTTMQQPPLPLAGIVLSQLSATGS